MFQFKNYFTHLFRCFMLLPCFFTITHCDENKKLLKHFIDAREAIAKAEEVHANIYKPQMYNQAVDLLLNAQKNILNGNDKVFLKDIMLSQKIANSIYQPALNILLKNTKEQSQQWLQKAIDANAEVFSKNELNLALENQKKANELMQNGQLYDSYKHYDLMKIVSEDAFILSRKNTETINTQSLQILVNELRDGFSLLQEYEQKLLDIETNIQEIKQLKQKFMLKKALKIFLSTQNDIEFLAKNIQKDTAKQKYEKALKYFVDTKSEYQELIAGLSLLKEHQDKGKDSEIMLEVKEKSTQKLFSLNSNMLLHNPEFKELATTIRESINESEILLNIAQEQYTLEQYIESYQHSEESIRLNKIFRDVTSRFFSYVKELQKKKIVTLSKEFKKVATLPNLKSSFDQWSTYIVKKRKERKDCLWRISAKANIYNNPILWERIYKANKDIIRDPNLIYPGQKLLIPPKNDSFTQQQAREYRKITK